MLKEIIVTVEGGVVQDVSLSDSSGLIGARVVVRDYDVEGCDESELETDSRGDHFNENVWELK